MPGHKRNTNFNITGSEIDITEIDEFDNLHSPDGIIKEMHDEISDLFGYRKSIISVNGSTCAILSAIFSICRRGDKIIIARNCHKSVYNACCLLELDVVYIEPEFNKKIGAYTNISQSAVDEIIFHNSDAAAVVITSPTYEGFISKIKCDMPLIIDSAHGAHFGFADWLPERPNADIVIQSLHKTLPCLTQTAVIHINNEKLFDRVKMFMDIFESSSPSYILLNSIDKCIDFLKENNNTFKNYKSMLDDFFCKVKKLDNITIHKNDDITRLIIAAKGYTGVQLAEHLRNNGIEPEGATLNYVILISTVADTPDGFNRLYSALAKIEKRENADIFNKKISIPKKIAKSSDIINNSVLPLTFNESIGKICAEYIFAYPPGIPILVPGELITAEIIDYIRVCIKNSVNIISDSKLLPNSILTKRL